MVGHSTAMMTGYHRLSALTAAAEWFDGDGKRFIRTGDIGRFDEDGFLVLMDRRKDMIISGGFNVYPSDIEAILREHRDVEEVAVVGVASARWGETPVAFIVPRPGAVIDAEALREWANARLGKLQRLHAIKEIASLPRSHIGKVLKRELRDAYEQFKEARLVRASEGTAADSAGGSPTRCRLGSCCAGQEPARTSESSTAGVAHPSSQFGNARACVPITASAPLARKVPRFAREVGRARSAASHIAAGR